MLYNPYWAEYINIITIKDIIIKIIQIFNNKKIDIFQGRVTLLY